MSTYTEGQVIEVKGYPFVRTVFSGAEYCADEDNRFTEHQEEGWRPGCEQEADYDAFDGISYRADGTGEMILTVISTHKPGGFQDRVFYTRQWRDPDGKVFGDAKKLRVMSASGFKRMCRGYRHQFCMGE